MVAMTESVVGARGRNSGTGATTRRRASTTPGFSSSHAGGGSSSSTSNNTQINKLGLWREQICEWCYLVVDHFDFGREAVSVTMSYLDRYLASVVRSL